MVSTACRSILIFAMTGVSSVASVTVIALLYGFWSGIRESIFQDLNVPTVNS